MKAMRRATDKLHLATFAGLLLLLVCAASAGAQTTSPYDSADIPTEQAPTSSSPVLDVDQESAAAIESPDSIDEELKEARARPAGVFRYGPVSLIDPYVKWFDRQADEYGLKVGLTYTTVFQGASGGPGERDAMGSNVGLFGNWRLLGSPSGKSNGYLYFFSETRYEIFTGIPPNDLSRQIGSIWGTTNAFDEEPLVMRDLYWQQQFGGDTVVLRAGKIDPQQLLAERQQVLHEPGVQLAAGPRIPPGRIGRQCNGQTSQMGLHLNGSSGCPRFEDRWRL